MKRAIVKNIIVMSVTNEPKPGSEETTHRKGRDTSCKLAAPSEVRDSNHHRRGWRQGGSKKRWDQPMRQEAKRVRF